MIAKLRKTRGFTLVELMIVVAIIGVLAALAIYGVNKYLTSTKTSEARQALGRMAKDAQSAFNREKMSTAQVLAGGGTAKPGKALCKSAAATVPAAATSIKGQKYQSHRSEWAAGDAETGWACLRFTMTDPQYFMYNYTRPSTTAFTAQAQGDLDDDGTLSTFALAGAVDSGEVKLAPTIAESNPEE